MKKFSYYKLKRKLNMKQKLLIVEDDEDMVRALQYVLSDYDCFFCHTLQQGLHQWDHQWNLILLDLGLPDGDGLDLLKMVRLESDVPVLILSGRDEENTMIEAYAQKGDDFIVKPVRLPVLKAKIDRLLTRNGQQRFGDIILSIGTNTLYGEKEIVLTGTETAILEPLFAAGTYAVSMDRILRSIWNCTGCECSPQTLSVRISGLRKKLEGTGLMLTGTRNAGYQLAKREDERCGR